MAGECFEPRWQGAPVLAANLRLRPVLPGDVPMVCALADDVAVSRYTDLLPHPLTPMAARTYVEEEILNMAAGRGVAMAVERLADGAFLGMIGLRLANGVAETGYWLGRRFWGEGYATEALRRMARLAFEGLGASEIRASVHPDNSASDRVLLRAGFALAGERVSTSCGRCGGLAVREYWLGREAWQAAFAARPLLLVTAVALLDADDRVLLARRPQGKAMAGLWEFPGGKVHAGETPERALTRELDEELGIDVRESCLATLAFASHPYDDFHLLMPLYVCRTWRGRVTAREGQTLAWVRAAALATYAMPPADAPLAATLRAWL